MDSMKYIGLALFATSGAKLAKSTREKYRNPLLEKFWDFPEHIQELQPSQGVHVDRVEHDAQYVRNGRTRPSLSTTSSFRPRYSEFDPLEPQTRLLTIDSLSQDGDITCSLEIVDLRTMGLDNPFTALSYQWQGDARFVLLDQQLVEVTASLHGALSELFRRGRRRVWIDALCLNQGDDAEKVQQLAYMHDIYSMASEVIVWLGPTDDSVDAICAHFADVEQYRVDRQTSGRFLLDITEMWAESEVVENDMNLFSSFVQKVHGRVEASSRLSAALEKVVPNKALQDTEAVAKKLKSKALNFLIALKKLVERSYWRRAWVMQEMTAARQIEIWSGTRTIDHEILFEMLLDLERLEEEGASVALNDCHKHILNLYSLKSRWQPDEPIHMLEALRDSYRTSCKDKFDEIYAVLGMCFNSRRFVPSITYAISMEQLLLRMTESHITSSGSLDLILMQVLEDSLFKLPTWAPDWRIIGRSSFNHRMISYLIGQDERPKPQERDRRWSAAGSSSWKGPRSWSSLEEGLLPVVCCVVGEITWLENATPRPTPRTSRISNLVKREVCHNAIAHIVFETMMIYLKKDRAAHGTHAWNCVFDEASLARLSVRSKKSYSRVVNRMRTIEVLGKSLFSWSSGDKVFTNWQNLLDLGNGTAGVALYALQTVPKYMLDKIYPWIGTPTAIMDRKMEDAFAKVVLDETLLMQVEGTGRGKVVSDIDVWYLGWAHPHATIGDQICLLEGCTLPVILRPVPGDHGTKSVYTVIGDAHVTGIMNGEAWPKSQQARQECLREIWLQ